MGAIVVGSLLLAGLLALPAGAAVTPGTTAGASALPADGPAPAVEPRTSPTPAQQVDADRTRIDVALESDGDAVWTLELWTRLEDDAAREAFAALQADVANDSEAFVADFEERMAGTIAAASEDTGREMTVREVSISTRTEAIPQEHGVLTYEFRWTAFAAVAGAELRAGDAVDAFLLDPGTRLTVRWPAEFRAASIEPEPDDRSDAAATWRGESTDFVTGEPRVVLTSAAERGWLLPAAALVALALLALAVGWWLVRTGRLSLPGRGAAGASTSASGTAAQPDGAPPATATAAGERSDAGHGGPGDGATEDAPDDGPPPELLSNEERVLRLLEANGGRLKQQQVVAELDWTEAKTSQVVTSMDEEGAIEKFRIGRENVLALPEEADL